MTQSLPIDALRDSFEAALLDGPVVLTAPTGTGKSTQVPRWLFERGSPEAPILVVQPRRVAARAVAARIAELERVTLGQEVGYRVRDDDCSSANTRLLVVTPGIVLSRPALLESAALVVLDELHERRLDTDLLLALLNQRALDAHAHQPVKGSDKEHNVGSEEPSLPLTSTRGGGEGSNMAPEHLWSNQRTFVAMSATLDGDAVARAVGGRHLSVETRSFPVEVSYIDAGSELPSREGLERKVIEALDRLQQPQGDTLVFLPGKGEIERVARLLEPRGRAFVCLHGGLSLKQQSAALTSGKERRIILSTNVAETSLTLVGVTAVVDSGLVRRSRYHAGRSYLTLAPVALDSADQRAGRAGRVAPGRCMRLWGGQARLEKFTPPEIHREELSALVMTCALLEVTPEELPFLDAPKEYALRDAGERLESLGAITRQPGQPPRLTPIGRELVGLPLDPWLSRFLVEARTAGCLQEAIDLVAVLEQPGASRLAKLVPIEARSHPTCDAMALLHLMRHELTPQGSSDQAAARTLADARRSARRLRRALRVDTHRSQLIDGGTAVERSAGDVCADHVCADHVSAGRPIDRTRLLRTLLRADPQSAHVSRRRKAGLVFSNGGTEMALGRDSLLSQQLSPENPKGQIDALLVLETHGVSSGREHRLLITAAAPIPLSWLAEMQLGSVAVKQAQLPKSGPHRGQIIVELERTFAGRVLETKEEHPTGSYARAAIAQLFLRGSLHRKAAEVARSRLARRALALELGRAPGFSHLQGCTTAPSLEAWILQHLEELGVESGEDLALLSADDFIPEDVPAELAPQLDERFPLRIDLGDTLYSVEYDLTKRQVMLSTVRGGRKTPPPANYLPRFEGFRVFVEAGGTFHPVRR